jgi:predicted RNase H-like HicB family nuclease
MSVMDKHEVIIFWSPEDDAFVAEVPELPGCAAHGASQEEALANAKTAARMWIETAMEFGDPVPEPEGRQLSQVGAGANKPTPSGSWTCSAEQNRPLRAPERQD